MPRIIDDRVLSMEFDNSKFEKNVDTSISTLDRLKDALSFKGTDKDFGIVETTVYQLGKSFNWLEEIGVGALRRFGSAISDWAVNTVKNLSGVNNAIEGFKKFGDMTESTGTLKAQGYAIDDINTQLDRLNWFADETSYNLTDMVGNIAKFTATGQGLEDSADAIMGIALWAALSGKNASQASSAMYQLSQALGAGVMRKEDWKSIQNLNMNTREFQQHALDAAVALKTLKKNSDGTYTSLVATGKAGKEAFNIDQFAERLTEGGWFTKDVMMKVFREYSSGVQQIYDYTEEHGGMASDAIKALEGEIDEFGMKAFKAGQEARTWGAVVDSVKDAASTGWMTVYQNLFGPYDKIVEFFTDLANRFYDIFVEPINSFNDVLESWGEKGGRSDFIQAIYGIVSVMENFIWVFKHVANYMIYGTTDADTIFGINVNTLSKITKAIKDFVEQTADTIKHSKVFRRYLRAFLTIFDMGWQIISQFGAAIKDTFSGVGSVMKTVILHLSYIVRKFYYLGKSTKANKSFYNFFVSLLKPLKNLKDWFIGVGKILKAFYEIRIPKYKEIIDEKLGAPMEKLRETIGKLKETFKKFWEGLFKGSKADYGKTAKKILGLDGEESIFDKLEKGFYKLTGWEEGSFFDHLANGIEKVVDQLDRWNDWLNDTDAETGLTGIEKIQNAWDSAIQWVKDTFGPIWEDLKTAFGDAFKWIIENWDSIWSTVKQVGQAIWSFLSGLWDSVSGIFAKKDGEEAGESTFTGLLDSLKTLGGLLGTVLGSILTSVQPLVDGITNTLGSLTLDNAGDFLKGGGLALLGAGFYQWTKNFKKSNWILGFGDLLESLAGPLDSFAHLLDGKALKEAAIGIAVLVGALILLISIPQDKMLDGAIVMSMIIDILTRSVKKLNGVSTSGKITKEGLVFSKTGAGSVILMLALSMVAIAFALQMIAKIPEKDLYRASFVIALMIAIVGLILKGIARIQNNSGKTNVANSGNTSFLLQNNAKVGLVGTLLGLAAFIGVVVFALQKITDLIKKNPDEFTKAAIVVGGILAALGVFLYFAGKFTRTAQKGNFSKSMDKGLWAAILALGAAIYLIALAFEKIANAGAGPLRMVGAGALIIAIMGIMILFVKATENVSGSKVAGAAAGLLIFSLAIGIVALVYAALAKILDTVKNPERVAIAFAVIGAIFLGFTFIMAKWGKDLNAKKMIGAAGSMVLVAVALAVAAASLLLLAQIPTDKIDGVSKMLVIIVLAVGALGLLASGPIGDGLVKIATTIILIAGAAALLGLGFLAAAEAIKIFSDSQLDIGQAVKNISTFVDQMLDNLPKWAEKVLATLLETILAIIPATVKALVDTFASTLAALVEEDPLTGELKIKSLIDNGLKVVLAVCDGIAEHAQEIVESVGGMLMELFGELNLWLVNNANEIGKTLADGLNAIYQVVVSTFDNIGEAIFGEEDWEKIKNLLKTIKEWLEDNIFSWIWDRLIGAFNMFNTLIAAGAELLGVEGTYVDWASGMSDWYDYYKKLDPNARNWDVWRLAQETYNSGAKYYENGIAGPSVAVPYTDENGEVKARIISADDFNNAAKNLLEKGLDTEEVKVDTGNGKVIIGKATGLKVTEPVDAGINTASISIKDAQLFGVDFMPVASTEFGSNNTTNSIVINNPPGLTAKEQYRQAKAGLARISAYARSKVGVT